MVRYHYLYSDDNLLCKLSCGGSELPNNVLDEGMVLLVHSFFRNSGLSAGTSIISLKGKSSET